MVTTKTFPTSSFLTVIVMLLVYVVYMVPAQGTNLRELQTSPKKMMAVHFKGITDSVVKHTTKDELISARSTLQSRIARVLSVESSTVIFSAHPITVDRPYITFGINSPQTQILVENSVSTSAEYTKYSTLWMNALKNDADVQKPISLASVLIPILNDKHEAIDDTIAGESSESTTPPPTDTLPTELPDDDPLIAALDSRGTVMQLKLNSRSVEDFLEKYDNLNVIVQGVSKAAAKVLGVEASRIKIYAINEGVVVQFSVFPATKSEVSSFNSLWKTAVTNSDKSITSIFSDVDFTHPAVTKVGDGVEEENNSSTTTTPKPSGHKQSAKVEEAESNAGLVAGAVLGSIAAVGLVGAGAGGYIYKKRKNQELTGKNQDFGERSPGAEGISPGGLSNVDIRGERTPNPHNY